MELKIIYLDPAELKPYEKNTRKHTDKDIKNIIDSIKKYGFNDPIGIYGKDNIIVEGHGRLLAAKKLGMDVVPCVRLDHMTDEQRREYAIAHNATAELSEWDFNILADELADLDMSGFDFGFLQNDEEMETNEPEDEPYTSKIDIPQYKPTGKEVSFADMLDKTKTEELIDKTQKSNVSNEEKDFLVNAAQRHMRFNYTNIAEYYAKATPEMQKLMEESALVLIDFNDAIKNGYAILQRKILEMVEEDE